MGGGRYTTHLSSPPAGGARSLRLEGAERGPGGLDDHPGAAALPAGVGLRARLDAAAGARVAAFQVADADLGEGNTRFHTYEGVFLLSTFSHLVWAS